MEAGGRRRDTSLRVETVTAACVRVGARVGVRAGASCEQSWSCWAGVGLNFRPLLYAVQHINRKNRGPICMLGWSCSYVQLISSLTPAAATSPLAVPLNACPLHPTLPPSFPLSVTGALLILSAHMRPIRFGPYVKYRIVGHRLNYIASHCKRANLIVDSLAHFFCEKYLVGKQNVKRPVRQTVHHNLIATA